MSNLQFSSAESCKEGCYSENFWCCYFAELESFSEKCMSWPLLHFRFPIWLSLGTRTNKMFCFHWTYKNSHAAYGSPHSHAYRWLVQVVPSEISNQSFVPLRSPRLDFGSWAQAWMSLSRGGHSGCQRCPAEATIGLPGSMFGIFSQCPRGLSLLTWLIESQSFVVSVFY